MKQTKETGTAQKSRKQTQADRLVAYQEQFRKMIQEKNGGDR